MSKLYDTLSRKHAYWDRKGSSPKDWFSKLATSNTLYVGNLSFFVTEDQILEVFSVCGTVVRIVIGLHKQKRQSCGFCFVQFSTHEEASYAHTLLNGCYLDERIVRCDWDTGNDIMTDRKFGRGEQGGQKRDERREEYERMLEEEQQQQGGRIN